MGLRTREQFIEGLRDGRHVTFRGERVADVTTHPVLGKGVRHAAIDFELTEDPAHRDLAVVDHDGEPSSRYFQVPRTPADLLARSRLIEVSTQLGKTLVILVKEIGTDALFGLLRVTPAIDAAHGTRYRERTERLLDRYRREDTTLAVAQTDVKGDRSLGPAAQPHPDYYVRIVERRPDGIVVRGAKMHTSGTTNVDEIVVLPTRAMTAADRDYAVAFTIPVATPGIRLIASPHGSTLKHEFDAPLSAEHKMMETITIFDDVFVPNERVLLAGEAEFAGPLALAFVEYHRFTAVSYKLPLVDALLGGALLLADVNGVGRAAHVRDKIVRLISYAETVRGLTELAAIRGRTDAAGICYPDPLTTNMAKYHFAHHFHEAVRDVQDIAGGMLVTGPGVEDFQDPETGPLLRHYLGGRAGVDGEARTRAMNLVSDLTAGDFGSYHAVLAVHAEGSLEAEKLMIARSYDTRRALEYARRLAGLP